MMRSLDFEEYLWAKTGDFKIKERLLYNMLEEKPLGDYEYKFFKDLFMEYISIGGMPSSVSEFLESNDFSRVEEIQN